MVGHIYTDEEHAFLREFIPGHHRTTAEWKAYCEQYNENPTEEIRHKMNAKYYDDGYTVIIGHRRLAAATAAGLTEVPCVIDKNMTPEEQITTMLSENMQRTDLTVYEQAKGFQMALDFGSDIDTVAKKSGFSINPDVPIGYGWLSPLGKFFESDWGSHLQAAMDIIKKNKWQDEFDDWNTCREVMCPENDFLCEVKGWVLIHNPCSDGGVM